MPAYKLKPACKDYLWGGSRLRSDFNVQSDCNPLAEAWVLSCHPDGPSTLEATGELLPDYIAAHPGCLGSRCAGLDTFPFLVKLIDAKNDLSIQVHPNDAYALAHEGQHGKSEMWVVLDAEPGAFLYLGFRHPITREEFARRIQDHTLIEVLNAVPVQKGDVIFIPAGTLHAICHGIVVAEIQQNSNVTYRVYDYGRVGHDGKPRALHIDEALDVTELAPPRRPDTGGHLGRCESFIVDAHDAPFAETVGSDSFAGLLVIAGQGTLEMDGRQMPLRQGDGVFLPAGSGDYRVTGHCRVLVTRV